MTLLYDHDPEWPERAEAEMARWCEAIGTDLVAIHHIGSTSVPGLAAKPVIDLIPVLADSAALDAARDRVTELGYEWLGPFGLPGRRYCRRDDQVTGRRVFQAHAYADGSPEVIRHLAFRDWLRAEPANARAYAQEKRRCAKAFPEGGEGYQTCKSAWIDAAEAQALEEYA